MPKGVKRLKYKQNTELSLTTFDLFRITRKHTQVWPMVQKRTASQEVVPDVVKGIGSVRGR